MQTMGYSKKRLISGVIALLMVVGVLLPGTALAQPRLQDSDEPQPAFLVIQVDGGAENITLNRSTWDDLNATITVFPSMTVLSRDYVYINGSASLRILCADLTVAELFSNGVADCAENPDNPAFVNMDTLDWNPQDVEVFVRDTSEVPAETDGVETTSVDSNTLSLVEGYEATIVGLNLDDEIQAYALAVMYATHGMYYDAINTLQTADNLQCVQQRPSARLDGDMSAFETPAPYLRLGEWYAVTGGEEASLRYLGCAQELAVSQNDLWDGATALARLAVQTDDAAQKTELYQQAIDNYLQLSASDAVDAMIELCGSANCSR